jgi:hypothetical protein
LHLFRGDPDVHILDIVPEAAILRHLHEAPEALLAILCQDQIVDWDAGAKEPTQQKKGNART